MSPGEQFRELFVVAESDKVAAMGVVLELIGPGIEMHVVGLASAHTIKKLNLKQGEIFNASV